MLYRPTRKTYNLAFEDFPGIEITALSASLKEIDSVETLNQDTSRPEKERRMVLFQLFADKLVSWNVAHPDTGEALPPTLDGLLELDLEFIMPLIIGWVTTITRASLPKGMNSSNGANASLSEESMRLLEKLQNQVKLPELNFTSD
jgi:hypothetical protein